MPDKANEHAPTTSQDSQAETTAGKPSPAALPAAGECACRKALEDMRLSCCQLGDFMYEPVRHCSQELVKAIDAALATPCQCEGLRAVLERLLSAALRYPPSRQSTFVSTFDDEWEAQFAELSDALQAAREALRPPAPDSTPSRRDGVAGDVQPLRPREQ